MGRTDSLLRPRPAVSVGATAEWGLVSVGVAHHNEEDNLRRKFIVALLSVTVALATTASAFAHDCFNPNKPDGAGVNYTIVGFDPNGPIFEQTGPGKGIGGFVALSPCSPAARPASRCTRSVTAAQGRGRWSGQHEAQPCL